MAINFPNNPAVNDTFTVGGTTFTFTGVKWESSAVVELSSDTTPSLGGDLDGGAKNINNVGVITATTFSGNADTATTATNAQGLTGDPNIQVTNATVLGNLDVQGTTSTIDTVVTAVDSLNVEGSVGIGTTTPNYKLEIDGDVGIRNNSESDLYFDVDYGNGTTSSAAIFSYPTRFGIKQGGNSRADNYIFYYNQDASTAANDYIYMQCGDAERLRITGSGDVSITGTVSDSIGPLRRLGINNHNAATYTLVATDAGKLIREATNSANITIPQNIFSAGDMISIFNVSGGNNTITQGSGTTLYNTADGATGNRTLVAKGVCTIVCTSTNEFIISGSGLS